jgi:hypothetical protein
MLRGVRNVPPDKKWNPIQMMRRSPSIPSIRVSISVKRTKALNEPRTGWSGISSCVVVGASVTLIGTRSSD